MPYPQTYKEFDAVKLVNRCLIQGPAWTVIDPLSFQHPCNDPALSAQVRPLTQMPQQVYLPLSVANQDMPTGLLDLQ